VGSHHSRDVSDGYTILGSAVLEYLTMGHGKNGIVLDSHMINILNWKQNREQEKVILMHISLVART
jgi:hypothetical protein